MTYSTTIDRVYEADVLVCGLGPSGITAATAAARMGARTMAVERSACAGGNITNARVVGICGAVDNLSGDLITGGITGELLRRAAYRREDDYSRTPLGEIAFSGPSSGPLYRPRTSTDHVQRVNSVRLLFDPEIFKRQADLLLTEAGVRLLYHCVVADTVAPDGRIREVIIAGKDGLACVRPRVVVDCTGDADVAARAGAPFEVAAVVQPGTLMFSVGGLVFDDFQAFYDECRAVMARAAQSGEIGPYAGPSVGWMRPGLMNFNATRLVFDAAATESITDAEIRARAEVFRFFEMYRRHMPAFRNAWVQESGPFLGARESRRIIGEYVLTLEDITGERHFADAIGLAGGIVDFHRQEKSGHSALQFVRPSEIPYRSLLPRAVDNLLVAGRCHSVTQMGAAVTRMGVTCMVMGEAAGRAAVLAHRAGVRPADVDVEELRRLLRGNGAILARAP